MVQLITIVNFHVFVMCYAVCKWLLHRNCSFPLIINLVKREKEILRNVLEVWCSVVRSWFGNYSIFLLGQNNEKKKLPWHQIHIPQTISQGDLSESVFWWLFTCRNSHNRRPKITLDGRTDGPTRQTDRRTDTTSFIDTSNNNIHFSRWSNKMGIALIS